MFFTLWSLDTLWAPRTPPVKTHWVYHHPSSITFERWALLHLFNFLFYFFTCKKNIYFLPLLSGRILKFSLFESMSTRSFLPWHQPGISTWWPKKRKRQVQPSLFSHGSCLPGLFKPTTGSINSPKSGLKEAGWRTHLQVMSSMWANLSLWFSNRWEIQRCKKILVRHHFLWNKTVRNFF